jgi:methylphosphotriester-DNA--protein-cysteine methyltransferase
MGCVARSRFGSIGDDGRFESLHGPPEAFAFLSRLIRAREQDGFEVPGSRSPFAARFKALIGEPPLSYLTRWRMLTASSWLRTTDLGVADIAERSGYQSDAAFKKAFKRQFGVSPGAYRRRSPI